MQAVGHFVEVIGRELKSIMDTILAKNARRNSIIVAILIVIAIIAILAAILFPVFARARENARRAICQHSS